MFSRRISKSLRAACLIGMGSVFLFQVSGLVEAQETTGQAKLKAGYPQEPVFITSENGWTNLPFNWDSKKISAYPPEEVRGKYPASISVTANSDGWVLIAQSANPFSQAQMKVFSQRFDRLKSTTFLAVEELVKSDWEPIGKVSFENAPYIILRKNVKSGEQIAFPIQADSGPFVIQSFDQDVQAEITAAKPVDIQSLKGSGGTAIAADDSLSKPASYKLQYKYQSEAVSRENGWGFLGVKFKTEGLSVSVPLPVDNGYPKKLVADVESDGWVLLVQSSDRFSSLERHVLKQKFKGLDSRVHIPPIEMDNLGWRMIGMVKHEKITYHIYRKHVKKGDQISLDIQADSGPFFMQSENEETTLSIAERVQYSDQNKPSYIQSGKVVVSQNNFEVANNSAMSEENRTGGAFPGAPPSGGMAIPGTGMSVPGGGMLTVMKNIFTGTPASVQPTSPVGAFPGAKPEMSNPFSGGAKAALKPEDKKSAFIAGVSLEELKCPVNRSAVKRELHSDYAGGVLFFSDDDAMAQFDKKQTSFSAEANYQLFLSGQATQKACPVSGKPFDEDVFIQVKSKQVAFENLLAKVKIDRARPLTKFKKIFGSRPFSKAFEVEIPAIEESQPGGDLVGRGALQFSNPNQLRNATLQGGANPRVVPTRTTPNQPTPNRATKPTIIRGGRERD